MAEVTSLALPLRLANIMVAERLITEEQLQKALAVQSKTHSAKLGTTLVEQGAVTEDAVLDFVARQCRVARVNLAEVKAVPDEALELVPRAYARKHMLVPFGKSDDQLSVAIADPLNVLALDELRLLTSCTVVPALTSERDIQAAQEKFYANLKKRKAPEKPPADEEEPADAITLNLPPRVAAALVQQNVITQAQLDEALDIQKRSGRPLGAVLVSRGFMTHEDLLEFISRQCGLGYIHLSSITEIPDDVLATLPKRIARKYTLIPFNRSGNSLMIAISDPLNVMLWDEIKLLTGCEIKPVLAAEGEICAAIDTHYGKRLDQEAPADGPAQAPAGAAEEAADWEPPTEPEEEDEDPDGASERAVDYDAAEERLDQMVEEATEMASVMASEGVELQQEADVADIDPGTPEVQKIINSIFMSALAMRASDIHIEPFEDPAGKHSRVRVRYRVDGVLRRGKISNVPWEYRNALMSKIKILADSMNITERRIPQTGHIHIKARNNPVEFRVEVVPTVYGESCVMRVMDRREMVVDIEKLGFLPAMHDQFLGLLQGIGGKKNFGLILVCGPTGSGKSNTLYAALNYINRPDIKIWTAENPVEFNIRGIVQVSVNPDIKLGEGKRFNFAASLRSFLRLDPDVIMVGEIRDEETAGIATEAAMTGHLVFATLHTNDAPSAVSRLAGMGLPGYLLADTIKAAISQRLSRRLCVACKEAYEPTAADVAVFQANHVELPPGAKLYRPKGCEKCMMSGYKGRVGTYELMIVGDHVRAACHEDLSTASLRRAAVKDGMRFLIQDSLEKVRLGLTSVREVLGRAGGMSVE